MKSRIFFSETYKKLQNRIKKFINNHPDFLSADTVSSTRATGDAIQHILESNFDQIIGKYGKDYTASFARRAMADLTFKDLQDLYYVVDVKTHRLETKFNMPNLTSIERLSRFYEEDSNYFLVLMIAYNVISDIRIKVDKVHFVPIEFLSWNCLTIGALGWGQIQIANANNIVVNHGYSRKDWMLEFCDTVFEFYPNEIAKIKDRIAHFKKVKKHWEKKEDIWK